MRPYPGVLPERERIYNYRHSRSRLPIENAFGIVVARWRIFQKPIIASIHNVRNYVMACLCLHNYLRLTENSLYCPKGFVDVRSRSGDIKEGDWRKLIGGNDGLLAPLKKAKGGHKKETAKSVRENLKDYFNNVDALSWQITHVRRTGHKV